MIVKKLKIYAKPSDRENVVNTGVKLTSNRLTRQVNIVIDGSKPVVDYRPDLREDTNYTIPMDGYLYFGWTPNRWKPCGYGCWDIAVYLNNTLCIYTHYSDNETYNYGLMGNNVIFVLYYQVRKNTVFNVKVTNDMYGQFINTCRFAFLGNKRPVSLFNTTTIPLGPFNIRNINGLAVGTARIGMANPDKNTLKQYGIPTRTYITP